ncbi:TonB-dependent receptor domain-containing protein [Stutzerimonas stutzeri]|uniref:TonB-dependent receptor domain-containing protein n=1 Tax=Stutzerimonas stutzeri TaxID=316 RepID=UPI000F73B52F|nr:TonB-dependent receptor [Stutzerimonas stutzeri]MBS9723578.1 TonB-dependent receptor [Stutzerimonas stutzeri]RRW18579.1 TonB-dependent receptor [Stutzerimonas stutzeri]RRW21785.1 TonB-dependent receptor [Stutzerimonas stutzeri]RRW25824.1 TonB-dependent receptor [Stutzerimonas stutzeri]
MSIPFARTALSCAMIGCSWTALAQNAPVTLNDTVVSASGFEQKITDAPASISVISQQELQEKRFANLAQALEDVEGIDVRQGTGKTGGLNISIRGMPSEYTLILIDGRRQNAAGNVTPNGFNETSTSFMPPMSAIERIEVIRGPMSTLYGSDAIGGVVNIITKKVSKEWGASLSLDHTYQDNRSYGDASKASFYTSGPLIDGLVGLQVRGSVYDRGESDLTFNDDSTVSRRGAAPVEGRNTTVGGRLTLTPNDDHDLSLDIEQGRQVYNNDNCQLGNLDRWGSGSGTAGCNTEQPTQANGYKDELRFERDQYALTHTGRFTFGTVDSSLMHNTTETLGRTIPGGSPTRPNGSPNPSFRPIGAPYEGYPSIIVGDDRELKTRNLVFDTKLVAPIGDAHTTTVGGQWWNAKMTDSLAGEDFEQTTKAVFAENEWRILDTLALTLGARYDDHEAFGGHLSPRAYLVWNGTDNWTLKGGVSRGYKAPDVNDLHDGVNGITNQGQSVTIGNPNLKPEESTSTEFGVYFDSLAGFNANATLFHNKFKDKIDDSSPFAHPLCVNNPATNSIPQGQCTQRVNINEAETQGLELAARWQFAPAWSLSGNYTYTDSQQKSGDDKGAPLTNTPKHMAHARLDWSATDRLTLWFKGEYRGERARFNQRYTNLSPDNKALVDQVGQLKAYEVFHLGGSFRASENVTLNASIYNLFDKDFLDGETYTSGGTTSWVSHYIQTSQSTTGTIEEGRRLWLSANFTF